MICGKNAQFHWYRLVSGREKTYDNCSVRLQGAGSKFTAAIGYRLCGTQVYDLNCEAIHLGKNTESSIRSSGVLDGQADKIMRGTIDFQTGAAGSIGNETEDVLLLSETVRNRSIPVILCAEEEVVGNHGASIGRPDENVLYYLQSRGIEEEEALQLIANAKLFSVIDKIPDAELREQLVSNMELN